MTNTRNSMHQVMANSRFGNVTYKNDGIKVSLPLAAVCRSKRKAGRIKKAWMRRIGGIAITLEAAMWMHERGAEVTTA